MTTADIDRVLEAIGTVDTGRDVGADEIDERHREAADSSGSARVRRSPACAPVWGRTLSSMSSGSAISFVYWTPCSPSACWAWSTSRWPSSCRSRREATHKRTSSRRLRAWMGLGRDPEFRGGRPAAATTPPRAAPGSGRRRGGRRAGRSRDRRDREGEARRPVPRRRALRLRLCRSGGMADAADLNSAARKGVRVRIPAPAPSTATVSVWIALEKLLDREGRLGHADRSPFVQVTVIGTSC